MKDKIIKCQDCQQEFVWTMGEQEFYGQKELEEPVRCLICRSVLKKAKEDKFRGEVRVEG